MSRKEITVLHVEDNSADAVYVKNLLESVEDKSYRYLKVVSLSSLTSVLEEYNIDIIILDLLLNDSSSAIATLQQAKRISEDIPIIIITGVCDSEIAAFAIRLGAHDYIFKKDVNREQLDRVILNAIERQKTYLFMRDQCIQDVNSLKEFYDNIIASTSDTLIIIDQEGKIEFANKAIVSMFGITHDKAIGMRIGIPILDDKPCKIEIRNIATNEILIADLRATSVESNGQKKQLLTMRDITIQSKIEDNLRTESLRLETTLENMAEGVITTNQLGIIEIFNKKAEFLTRYKEKYAIGKHISHIFDIEYNNKDCNSFIKSIIENRQPIRLSKSARLLDKHKIQRNISAIGSPLFDADHDLTGICIVFHDTTSDIQHEKELVRSDKLQSIGDLAGGISHDYNNLLTGILGNISLAKMLSQDGKDIQEYLDLAEQALYRCRDLTNKLLTFSRGGKPVKRTQSINQLLNSNVPFILSGSNVLAHLNLPNDLWQVNIDSSQITQVINNIVRNAQQAMPDGGTITINAENLNINAGQIPGLIPGKYVKISVIDKGEGLDPKIIDRVFDPYFSTKSKNRGLGLAICYSIIKKHGGKLTVTSKMGKGSEFSFYLPAAVVIVRQNKKVPNSNEIMSGSGRVLIVDDESVVIETAKDILNFLGYRADGAANSKKALELFSNAVQESNPYDIIILDLTIPGDISGEKILNEMLKIEPRTKAIVSSGYSNNPIMSDFQSYGFSGMVSKPYNVSELSIELKRVAQLTSNVPQNLRN